MVLYYILLPLAWLVFHIGFRVRCEGRENLKKIGTKGCIIAPNHISAIDPVFVVITRFWGQRMTVFAKKELFEINPFLSWFFRCAGAVCVRGTKEEVGVIDDTVKKCQEGGTLLLSTPAEKLIYKDGKVEGVVAKNAKGDTITVNAKNVILATGGYNFNVDMVKKLTGIDMIPVGAPGRTGDGIKMAMDDGAIGDNMGPMMINGAFMPAEGEAICNGANKEVRALFRQGLLYVDSTGSRFFNEELTIDWPQASNAIARTGEWTYIVFDEATKREFSTEGKGYPNPCGNFIQRHQAATQLDALLKANEAKGNVFIGNTIEEVAKKAGMDPATLKASADMMTKFAKQGRDDQFGKDKYYLRAVSEGPFYVVRGKLNTLTSLNGVKVNADLQVLDKNDHVIQGLYAIGHDAGGVYGDSYDLKVGEGTASAFAINSGRMAVRKILADK